jgi:hypothetical protein
VLVAACICLTGSALAASPSSVSLQAGSQQLQGGQKVTLSGTVAGASPGTTVALYGSPYPYIASSLLGTATIAPDGLFEFSETPDRDTRYQAAVQGQDPSAPVEVDVRPRTITKVRALTLGRAQVTLVVFHPNDLIWVGVPVRWWFASGSRGAVAATTSTASFTLSPYVTVLRATLALPAGRFSWRACFDPPGAQALADPGRPPSCNALGYQGSAALPTGLPGPPAIARAAAYLAGRTGRTAFAVIDSEGRLSGRRMHSTFFTASVVKAMLLVGYLRRLDARGQRRLDAYSNSFLYPMIHISDNNAATRCWSIVGDSGLYAVAAAAHMTDFSVRGLWGSALLSPADQARFFFEMDSLIPKEFVGYARFLLSTIDPSQSWAIPLVARPLGYQVFFKDGSEPTALGQLVHQVARLEGHGRTISIAVMTDGDPTMQYGIDTIAGVTRALLR